MNSVGLKVNKPKDNLTETQRDTSLLSDNQVLIKVWFCGICHTDLHEMDNDWDRESSFYPFIPGHEIIGEITQVGKDVRELKPGLLGCFRGPFAKR